MVREGIEEEKIIGAAFDSLVILLEFGGVATVLVMVLAIWRTFLAGNFKTSLIRRKPLLVPSLAFIIAIIIVITSVPLPISAYHGTNQTSDYGSLSARFRVYESGAYERDIQVRVAHILGSNERVEILANFSQDGVVVDSFLINMTHDALDSNGGLTQSISLEPGLYNVSIENRYYVDDTQQDQAYIYILVNQPIDLAFIPELTTWGSYQLILGFCILFLFLGGLCIGREDKTRRSMEPIDQEPPRDERYPRKFRP